MWLGFLKPLRKPNDHWPSPEHGSGRLRGSAKKFLEADIHTRRSERPFCPHCSYWPACRWRSAVERSAVKTQKFVSPAKTTVFGAHLLAGGLCPVCGRSGLVQLRLSLTQHCLANAANKPLDVCANCRSSHWILPVLIRSEWFPPYLFSCRKALTHRIGLPRFEEVELV